MMKPDRSDDAVTAQCKREAAGEDVKMKIQVGRWRWSELKWCRSGSRAESMSGRAKDMEQNLDEQRVSKVAGRPELVCECVQDETVSDSAKFNNMQMHVPIEKRERERERESVMSKCNSYNQSMFVHIGRQSSRRGDLNAWNYWLDNTHANIYTHTFVAYENKQVDKFQKRHSLKEY